MRNRLQISLLIPSEFKRISSEFPLLKSNLLASTIGGEVTAGSYWGYVVWDFIPGRFYQGEQARYRQPMTEPWPTLAGYGEVLVLQQDECGLCSRWILSRRSMVYTTRCWEDELLKNQPTAKINQFSQRTTATISSTGEHSWYQLSKDHYDSTSNQKLIPDRSSRGSTRIACWGDRSRFSCLLQNETEDKFLNAKES